MTRAAAYIFTLFLSLLMGQSALAEKRIALVIGNAAYSGKVGPLRNPHNDIALVARSLRSVGFAVMPPVTDANRSQLLLAIYDFAARLKEAGKNSVGFFYYAGHGIAAGGNNYLIPVDVASTKARVLNVKGVKLDEITALLRNNAPDADHFVVFDACRNKLRGSRGARSFVPVKDRNGMMIAFSTAPGDTADDGDADNGPYALALAGELVKPGQDHLHLFHNIRATVFASTGAQVPWVRDGLLKRLYLGGKAGAKSGPAPSKAPARLSEAATEWASLKNSKDAEDLEAYIAQFGKSFPYYGRKAKKRLRKLKEKKMAVGVFSKLPAPMARPSFKPDVVLIPGGKFSMGCVTGKDCFKREKPVHRVTVSSFYLSKFEVTVGQFKTFVEETGHDTGSKCWTSEKKGGKGKFMWNKRSGYSFRKPGFAQNDDQPVVCVSWNDAVAYAKWLSRKTGQIWRLPTESEWEYAARAGSRRKYSWGNSIGISKANCHKDCKDEWEYNTSAVGSFSANEFGLYDMHGNVWEWGQDWYGEYRKGSQTNPKGLRSGEFRVFRGGSWYSHAHLLRSAYRDGNLPGYRSNVLGFRVARSLPLPRTKASLAKSNSCITIGRKIPSRIKLTVGTRFCDAARKNEARVLKIANRVVVFLDNGVKKTCAQGKLCAFKWPVKPLFRIIARADKAKGIAPQATMEPRR